MDIIDILQLIASFDNNEFHLADLKEKSKLKTTDFDYIFNKLNEKRLIEVCTTVIDDDGFQINNHYRLTNEGLVLLNNHKIEKMNRLFLSIKEWIAIIISIIALLIAWFK